MSEPHRHALVTGGAGFIGGHLVRALLARGLAVTVLDNLSVGREENVPDAARLIRGDILDAEAVTEALADCDVLFHLAARVAIRSSFEHVTEDTTTNVTGTANLLSVTARHDHLRRIVFTSSMAVYCDPGSTDPIDEQHPTLPISPYGVSKLAAERLTHLMCAASGKTSVALRLFNTYGPGQSLSPYVGVVTIFVNQLLRGEPSVIYGDGEQCRDFVHVEDVVAAFLGTLGCETSGETMNIGSGRPTTVNQVFDAVRRTLDIDRAAEHLPAIVGEVRHSVANIARAGRVLGYQPRHRFDSSIGDVVARIVKAGS